MNSDNLLLTVAAVAVIVSIVGISVTYNSISTFDNFLTGFATEVGYVNVSISSSASINITSAGGNAGSKAINYGAGTVDTGKDRALLVTNNTVTDGSWSAIDGGFLIENIGNVNVTLNVSANMTAATIFPASTSPQFQYNISNNEANACSEYWAGYEAVFKDFTTSASDGVCRNFSNMDSRDELRMDILFDIPSDASENSEYIEITLTYSSV
jgi:hypothetical protein